MKKYKISIKLAIILVMTLGLLIPSFLIQELIRERSYTNLEAAQEIASKWGKEQMISTPVLGFEKTSVELFDKQLQTIYSKYILCLEKSESKITVKPQIKKRGIFETVVYESDISIKGNFSLESIHNLQTTKGTIIKHTAECALFVSDLEALVDNPEVSINGEIIKLSKLNIQNEILSFELPVSDSAAEMNFSIRFKLKGNKQIELIPNGLKNKIELESHWNTVSYIGTKLPDSHTEKEKLANAYWQNVRPKFQSGNPDEFTNFTQFFDRPANTLGASFIIPVDQYQLVTRAAKYAIMFIVLTFTAFFFIEILNKKRIHPVQYLLVSIALLLFYTLLLSFSEQIGFNAAYGISALAIVALISMYTRAILKSGKHAGITALSLSALYGFLYILLQLETYALIAGSLGLFIVLAVLMYVSRKVDWYGEES